MIMLNIRVISLIFISIISFGCEANNSQVTMNNIDNFKSKMLVDLPMGTAKDDVVKYLEINDIGYTYLENKKIIYASIPKVGRSKLIYEVGLFIKINLDDDENSKSIEFSLHYDGL